MGMGVVLPAGALLLLCLPPPARECDSIMATDAQKPLPSLTEIKKKIPSEYFRSSAVLSMYYVFRSTLLVSLSAAIAYFALYDTTSRFYVANSMLRAALWLLYWNFQGMLFWGIFTIGHDCGHASFSRYPLLNQFIGNLSHSFLLVPYESWKLSHNYHHKNTGNMDRDEIFYPQRSNAMYDWSRRAVVVGCAAAWWIYLVGSQHFNPYNSLHKGHRIDVVISLVCWWAMAYSVFWASMSYGTWLVGSIYGIPLVIMATWLVVTTFLHHNDEDAPWYADSEWDYVKGNLSSVDRSYGWGVDNLIHNIDTHQIHHLFPIIPHYHLVDSTSYFRLAFPELVRISEENNFKAFFSSWMDYLSFGHSVPKDVKKFVYREAKMSAQHRN